MPSFKTSDGICLHYADEGSGTPILALPGLTRNGGDFDYVAPHLRDTRLIRLDARGRGQSAWANPETYQIAVEARDVIELLDCLALDRAAILGTSRGGIVGMFLASIAKPRLSGVCLVDIGPKIEERGLAAIGGYIGKDPNAKTYEEAASVRAASFPDFRNVPHERWVEEARKAYVRSPTGLTINYDPGLADRFRSAEGSPKPDLWPLFDALAGLPLALIRGENSNLLSAETAAEMSKRRPDMIVGNVPDRGHVPFLDEPESVAAIRTWVDMLP